MLISSVQCGAAQMSLAALLLCRKGSLSRKADWQVKNAGHRCARLRT